MTNEQAIQAIKEHCYFANLVPIGKEALDMAIKALELEPKSGHWELDESDNSITCTDCGCYLWANDIMNGEAIYCPNCGRKMGKQGE